MTPMSLNVKSLPHRRLEAWKWTDVAGKVTEAQTGLSVSGLPHFDIPKGVTISEVEGDDLQTDTPMADLDLDAEARLTLIEHYDGSAGGFSNLDLTITLKAGAKLTRVIIHNDPADHLRVATAHVTAWKGAELEQFALSFGGSLSRLETRLAVMGENVEATLNGAYLLDGKRHTDMTSYIDLSVPNCTIRQAVKGVTTDKARGVFQGKFHVRRPAQHTDAEMRHDALMLSDTSEIRSKPELEIYADDVACAHGNTIGQLDESALFYMRQRGIPLGQARAMLTEAFVADVYDDLEDEGLREAFIGKVRAWLEQNS